MRKYFLYEIKKAFLATLIMTAVASAIYAVTVVSGNYKTYVYGEYSRMPNSPVAVPIIMLMVLCTLVPVLTFSFKMNAKKADVYYSMPIKREKMFLVKSVVGLVQTLIPYTIAFWLGFILILFKEHDFVLGGFVSLYFLSLPLAVVLFGINAFVFTRANSVVDGLVFILAYSCAPAVFSLLVYDKIQAYSNIFNESSFWFTYSPLTWLSARYTEIISGRLPVYSGGRYLPEWLFYLFAACTGVAGWIGLLVCARKEKPEFAEHISDSKFGYITFIPAYVFLFAALVDFAYLNSILLVLIGGGAIVAYIIFRRSVKLKFSDWVTMASAMVAGIIIALIG